MNKVATTLISIAMILAFTQGCAENGESKSSMTNPNPYPETHILIDVPPLPPYTPPTNSPVCGLEAACIQACNATFTFGSTEALERYASVHGMSGHILQQIIENEFSIYLNQMCKRLTIEQAPEFMNNPPTMQQTGFHIIYQGQQYP